MTNTSDKAKDPPPIWEYVPMAEYKLPTSFLKHSAEKRLALFRRFLRKEKPENDSPIKTKEELQALSHRQLERLIPAPDLFDAAEALETRLHDWLDQENPVTPVIVLVGAPYSYHAKILTHWAHRKGLKIVPAPSLEQILAGDESWLDDEEKINGFWMLPALERLYLRHASGLTLIRRFLERSFSGDFGCGIIGCDSWAWAYLCHLRRGKPPFTLTLQAFDHKRLAELLRRSTIMPPNKSIAFRQSNNGLYVVPPEKDETSHEISQFLHHIATQSRGIWGIAWEFWRTSLRTEPDNTMMEKTEKEDDHPPDKTIWVTPWEQINLPSVQGNADRNDAFILHTLLLHNGLPLNVIQDLLPMPSGLIAESILQLQETGVIFRQDENWQVSPLGYPAVRQFLKSNGFLVDHF